MNIIINIIYEYENVNRIKIYGIFNTNVDNSYS